MKLKRRIFLTFLIWSILFLFACKTIESPSEPVSTSTSTSSSSGGSTSGDCPNGRSGAICKDGTKSSATGSGACSSHGGVRSWICK